MVQWDRKQRIGDLKQRIGDWRGSVKDWLFADQSSLNACWGQPHLHDPWIWCKWDAFIAQRVDSIYLTDYFSFAKNTHSVPQTFAHRGHSLNHRSFNTAVFCLKGLFRLQRQRLCERGHIHSTYSSFTPGKSCTHAIFLQSLATPERSLDTWPLVLKYVNLTWICKWAL